MKLQPRQIAKLANSGPEKDTAIKPPPNPNRGIPAYLAGPASTGDKFEGHLIYLRDAASPDAALRFLKYRA